MATSVIYPPTIVDYPSSDGMPVAEGDFQRVPLFYAVEALGFYFRERSDVYVSGNLFIYYEEGNPKAVVAPDVFVVFGAAKRMRTSYFLWQEAKAPDLVIEFTSRSTVSEDQGTKRGLYAFLGVREYLQFDPTGDYLEPQLQGSRLVARNYRPMATKRLSDGTLALYSDVLGLDLRLKEGELRFVEPVSGQILLNYAEQAQARHEAEERARQEVVARQAAEARIEELEALLKGRGAGEPPAGE